MLTLSSVVFGRQEKSSRQTAHVSRERVAPGVGITTHELLPVFQDESRSLAYGQLPTLYQSSAALAMGNEHY